MATGEIGSIIEQRAYSAKAVYSPIRVPGTNFYIAATTNGSSPKAAVVSFSCDNEGNLSDSVITLYVYTTATYGTPTSQVFHVSGYVYAMVYRTFNTPYNGRVATFSINPETGVLTQIADTIIGSGSSYNMTGQIFQNCVHVYGTVYACVGLDTHSGFWYTIETFSISADGTSIALIQRVETAAAGQCYSAIIELAPNKFAVLCNITSGNVMLYTYNISDAGAITLLDSEILDASAGTYRVGIINVSGTTYLLAYACTAAYRLRTITIGDDGTIGASIDTDDSIMTYRDCYALSYLPGLFALIGAGGNGSRATTFNLALDGTIGSVIDTGGFGSYLYGFEYSGVGDIYVGTCDTSVFSVNVIIPDPEIETLGTSEVKYDRATLWGNIIEAGVADAYGFDWSLATGDFENELLSEDPITPGLFCIELTGLEYNTYYKYRAKIGVGGVWFYGEEAAFSTTFPVPQVFTDPASAADDHWIDAVGYVHDDGGVDPIDEYGFAYGLSTKEDMLGLFDYSLDKSDNPHECTGPFDYDACEFVKGTLKYTELSASCASGQPEVEVLSATGIESGMKFKLMDDDNEEYVEVNSVDGLVVTLTENLSNSYSSGARFGQVVTIRLRNLEYGKRYYFRFWAHNKYGWGWGSEMCALTSDTANVMIPMSTASKGIRFCIPGKLNFPPTGKWYDTRHHLLVKCPDSFFVDEGAFGWVNGKYVAERQYYAEATNRDLYDMSNPVKRTGDIVKVKYKCRIGNNDYGLNDYHKRVISNGASELTGEYLTGDSRLQWFCEIFYNNPWTSNPWSIEETDDLLMGISIRSGTGWEQPLCDCIEGMVLWANAAVTTKSAIMNGLSQVRLKGLVTEDECEACEVWFEYGPTVAYGSSTTKQSAVKGQEFYADISAPPAGEYYHFRTCIETACGETFYGDDLIYPNRMILEIAFEQSILTVAPEWTDVTPYCIQLHTQRGRNHELDRCDAGTGTFILNNATGDWYRYNTGGAFYGAAGGVKPLTLIRLRYSYNGICNIFYGVIESFKPNWLTKGSGFHPVMECKSVDVFKSFTRYKIVDANPQLTEDATAGHDYVYVDSVYGLVEGQSIKIYEGEKEQITTINQVTPSLNLVFFDDVLAENYGTDAKLKKFPSVLSGQRIKDILLEVRWPEALTSIDDGQVMVVELTPGAGGDNAMDELYRTTEAENGNLFVAGDGKVTFHDSIAMTKSPYNTSQATFKDDGTGSKFYDPELSDDDEFIYNESNISGEAIGEQIMLDGGYQDEQGPRSLDRKDSRLSDPDDAFDQVTINVERYKDSIQRCSGLILRPEADPDDLFPKALGYELGTRITLQLNSTRNPAMIDIDRHILGVTHDWSVWSPWETKWQLWDVNRSYVFRSQHEGWLDNYLPEPYTYEELHDDEEAAAAHNDTEEPIEVGQVAAVPFSWNDKIRRGQIELDTSKLDAGWTIESAKIILMLKPQLQVWDRKAFDLCIVGTYNSNQPVLTTDFGNMGDQEEIFGSVTVPADFKEADPFHPVGVYMIVAIELSAAGIAHINKGGTSRFWLRSDHDIESVEPTDEEGEWVLIEGHLGAFPPRLLVKLA